MLNTVEALVVNQICILRLFLPLVYRSVDGLIKITIVSRKIFELLWLFFTALTSMLKEVSSRGMESSIVSLISDFESEMLESDPSPISEHSKAVSSIYFFDTPRLLTFLTVVLLVSHYRFPSVVLIVSDMMLLMCFR